MKCIGQDNMLQNQFVVLSQTNQKSVDIGHYILVKIQVGCARFTSFLACSTFGPSGYGSSISLNVSRFL